MVLAYGPCTMRRRGSFETLRTGEPEQACGESPAGSLGDGVVPELSRYWRRVSGPQPTNVSNGEHDMSIVINEITESSPW